jgi:hypothetical protein
MNVFRVDSCHIPSQHCPFTGVFSLLPRSLSFEQKARLELGMATLLWSQSAKDNDTVFLLMFNVWDISMISQRPGNLEQALNMSCLSSASLSTVPFIYILWNIMVPSLKTLKQTSPLLRSNTNQPTIWSDLLPK